MTNPYIKLTSKQKRHCIGLLNFYKNDNCYHLDLDLKLHLNELDKQHKELISTLFGAGLTAYVKHLSRITRWI